MQSSQGGVALLADPCRGSIDEACEALARQGLRVSRRPFRPERLPASALHLRHGFGAKPAGQLIWAERPVNSEPTHALLGVSVDSAETRAPSECTELSRSNATFSR